MEGGVPGRDLAGRTLSPQRTAQGSLLGAEGPGRKLEARASQALLGRGWGVFGFYSE